MKAKDLKVGMRVRVKTGSRTRSAVVLDTEPNWSWRQWQRHPCKGGGSGVAVAIEHPSRWLPHVSSLSQILGEESKLLAEDAKLAAERERAVKARRDQVRKQIAQSKDRVLQDPPRMIIRMDARGRPITVTDDEDVAKRWNKDEDAFLIRIHPARGSIAIYEPS